jgi:hypothetical protein
MLVRSARDGKRCIVRTAILQHGGFWKKVGAIFSRSVGLKVDERSANETSGGRNGPLLVPTELLRDVAETVRLRPLGPACNLLNDPRKPPGAESRAADDPGA